jgi:hypothetical protein
LSGKCLYGLQKSCDSDCPAYVDSDHVKHVARMNDIIYTPISVCGYVNAGVLPEKE